MTEKEKMLAGKIYDSSDPELAKLRQLAHALSREYNLLDESEVSKREGILRKLLGFFGEGSYLQGPIQFDYGSNTSFGERCYANFNLTVLDVCPIKIGNDVFFGPNCSLYAPLHPLLASERSMYKGPNGYSDQEYGAPIVIEDGVWVAGNVTILGGVTIGARSVIGAGSVVTRSLPPDSVCVGDPCRPIRKITEADSIRLKEHLW